MKILLSLLAFALAAPLHASTYAQRTAAENIVREISGPNVLKASVQQALDPFLRQLRRDGLPDQYVEEVRDAFLQWLEHDIVWSEIAPDLAAALTAEFTAKELAEISAFAQTDAGKKFLKQYPKIMSSGNALREDYAKSKQPQLMQRISPIIARYEAAQSAEQQSRP